MVTVRVTVKPYALDITRVDAASGYRAWPLNCHQFLRQFQSPFTHCLKGIVISTIFGILLEKLRRSFQGPSDPAAMPVPECPSFTDPC